MNSRNLSEKGFDAEIKGRLENSSVPFDPESWEKMSQKLDHVFPNNNSGDSGSFGLLVVAFLLSAWFFWNVGTFSQTKSSLLGTDNITVDKISNKVQGEPEVSTTLKSSDIPNSVKEQNSELLQDTGQKNQVSKSETNFFNPAQNNSDVVISTIQVFLAENDHSMNKMEGGTTLERTAGTLIASNGPDIELLDQQPLQDKINAVNLREIEDQPVIRVNTSPWFLGFGYAPDISMVGFSEVTKPGTNLSIILEYQLNRRWSINSGITYSKKNYTAKGEDYNPPKGFWDYGFVPDMTEGYCEVIDIPLNIRYYFKPEKINRLFASTGLSTYLMLTEEYFYQYKKNDPQHLVQSWSGKNENQHYFAIYNMSVGYQRAIGKRWFLEIEPFIKLPLTGVGFGRVDLWSTGALFSLKYNFR